MGGASVCEGIRQYDKKGSVMMVGNEGVLAYSRPMALKQCLGRGSPKLEEAAYLPEAWFENERIDVRLATQVTQLDIERRIAVLSTGQAVEFRKACLAMGSRARRLPVAGASLGNIFYLRTARDVLALREVAEQEVAIVVVGGGCIAAESAALLSEFPKARVTLLHRGKHLWGRRLDEQTAAWLTDYFTARGVKMLMGETLNGFEGGMVLKNVQTKSGLRVPAGGVVTALGVDLNLGLVAGTPLGYPHGTPVNDFLETDEKGIFAVGDVAAYPDRHFGVPRRLDYFDGIVAQGQLAGANLTAKKRQRFEWLPHRKLSFFDLKFDFLGDFSKPPNRVEIEGDRAGKEFVVRYYQLDILMGILFCNQPAEVVQSAREELVNRPRELKKQAAWTLAQTR
ncbi:MAG: FAD-dependent pyridine nucleotide-disulfide oxidoreductase [Chthoniobacteraceae bacterium]|nr:FAD-dependent pyridine nucleotide-disulfide oxidoreductase [Chthoniobacteraceae bacterium]